MGQSDVTLPFVAHPWAIRRPAIAKAGQRRSDPGRGRRLSAAARMACLLLLLGSAGCREASGSRRQASRPAVSRTGEAQPTTTPRAAGSPYPAPGGGVVIGRLVDGATGLAVGDSGVSVLDLGRRTVSGIDGTFRFDGVPAGALTLVFGPVDGYVPRSMSLRIPPEGVDVGLVVLRPCEPPTLLVPDLGGRVAGCGDVQLALAPGSLSEAAAVGITCLESDAALPAAPPPGRLPLAAVHIEPSAVVLGRPGELVVSLPSQPRFTSGVALDLLRLDLDRLVWRPVGTVAVQPGGRTAKGEITGLGTYLVAAPPFGASANGGDRPSIVRIGLTSDPEAEPSDTFDAGIPIVYLSLDYAHMANTKVLVRTADRRGRLFHESERPYSDSGRDHVPMSTATGHWPAGDYVTSVYLGDPPAAVDSIAWHVLSRAAAATLPLATSAWPRASAPPRVARPTAPAAQPCRPRYDWYAYGVRAGDTLYSLARRTGSTVDELMRANCLRGATIYAGTTLYLPRPPARDATLPPPAQPTAWGTTVWWTPWRPWPTPAPAVTWPPRWPVWPTATPAAGWPTWAPPPTAWPPPPVAPTGAPPPSTVEPPPTAPPAATSAEPSIPPPGEP